MSNFAYSFLSMYTIVFRVSCVFYTLILVFCKLHWFEKQFKSSIVLIHGFQEFFIGSNLMCYGMVAKLYFADPLMSYRHNNMNIWYIPPVCPVTYQLHLNRHIFSSCVVHIVSLTDIFS